MKPNFTIEVILNFTPKTDYVILEYSIIEKETGEVYGIWGKYRILSTNIYNNNRVIITPTKAGHCQMLGEFDNEWFCQGSEQRFKQKWMG